MSPASRALAWDYSRVAGAYLLRPGYAPAAIDAIVGLARLSPGALVADVGAGTGNLVCPLLDRSLRVVAIEPDGEMRRRGKQRTAGRSDVRWSASRAESMPFDDGCFDAVTFGSSFNVVDQPRAIAESARVTRPGGFLACLWNHRCLDDPLQAAIEETIRRRVPGYSHGSRRSDPSAAMLDGGWFDGVRAIEAGIVHTMPRSDFVSAWASHLTLRRQAGPGFEAVLGAIERLLCAEAPAILEVPYLTRAWVARRTTRSNPVGRGTGSSRPRGGFRPCGTARSRS